MFVPGLFLTSRTGRISMLTRKQHELLLFIHERLKENRHTAFVRRDEGGARSGVEVRHPPPDHRAGRTRFHPPPAEPCAGSRSSSATRFHRPGPRAAAPFPAECHRRQSRQGAGARAASFRRERRSRRSRHPRYGRIAAGVPIEAIQHQTHTIAVPPEMLSGGEHYALEVRGDSMIEAGILDGDT